MSKYHGEQFWVEIRHQALQGWQNLSDDDFETMHAIRHRREVQLRDQRDRARRDRQTQRRDVEL